MINKVKVNVDGDYIMMIDGCSSCPLCHESCEQGFNSYICEALGIYTNVGSKEPNYILPNCPVNENRVLIYRKKQESN